MVASVLLVAMASGVGAAGNRGWEGTFAPNPEPGTKPAGDGPPVFQPTRDFRVRPIAGWTVRVDVGFAQERRDVSVLGQRILERLRWDLEDVKERLPSKAVRKLQRIPLWLCEVDPLSDPDEPPLLYFESMKWLVVHDRNPDQAGAIEISRAAAYLEYVKTHPHALLRQLARAYHHKVVGGDDKELRAAWEQAGARGLRPTKEDQGDYFARGTVAFFAVADTFPRHRNELRQSDPLLFRVLRRIWEE